MAQPGSQRAEKKAAKRADKDRKKAAQKEYDRNHAQLKRQQAFHAVLLAGQIRRQKKVARKSS